MPKKKKAPPRQKRKATAYYETASWREASLDDLLGQVLAAWTYRDHEDVEVRTAIVPVLRALHLAARRGDIEALDPSRSKKKGSKKNVGPVKWAKRYLRATTADAPPEQVDALRELVEEWRVRLHERGDDALRDQWLRVNAEAIARAFWVKLEWLNMAHALPIVATLSGGGWCSADDAIEGLRVAVIGLASREEVADGAPDRVARLIVMGLLRALVGAEDAQNAMREVH